MGASYSENIHLLESKIGYRFKKKALAREALTHKSFAKEQPDHTDVFNERLEFLGDAVLGLLVSHYLFDAYPGYSESGLSKVKAFAVRESTLADVAADLGIGEHLYLGKGEEASGGRKKVSLLANSFEAVLAAVYLDGGLKNARAFTIRSLERKIQGLIKKDLLYDYKTRFQEVVQDRFGVLPDYVIHREEGPEHMKTFEVKVYIKKELYGAGSGRSKKEASQKAAQAGLEKLVER